MLDANPGIQKKIRRERKYQFEIRAVGDLKADRNTSNDINSELILESPQNHYLFTTPMKCRLDNHLDRFLSSTAFFGEGQCLFIFFIIFTPVKKIAPQKRSSIIVVFVAKAPSSHPIFSFYPFTIHT